jgi:hypothetical protein
MTKYTLSTEFVLAQSTRQQPLAYQYPALLLHAMYMRYRNFIIIINIKHF